jgi:hypothetical protein
LIADARGLPGSRLARRDVTVVRRGRAGRRGIQGTGLAGARAPAYTQNARAHIGLPGLSFESTNMRYFDVGFHPEDYLRVFLNLRV